MPSLRLTRRAIDEIPFAQKGQVLYRDTMLPGFGSREAAKRTFQQTAARRQNGTNRQIWSLNRHRQFETL